MSVEKIERMKPESVPRAENNAEVIEKRSLEAEGKPLTEEQIDKKVANFWEAHNAVKPPKKEEKKLGITRMAGFVDRYPEVPIFYTTTAMQLESHPERLEEFNELWQKFILGEKMTIEEKGILETFYRSFLKG